MLISLDWLSQHLDLPTRDSQTLSDLLTFAGIEIEDQRQLGVSSPLIVVGKILAAEPHPNADRLKVTQVDAGEGSPRQIVCGATNYQVGDCVPCCLPGAELGEGFTIGETKMRGVESRGMLAAASEIGLPDQEDGLLILPPDSVPGTPLAELFPADLLFEVEITPNRPDLLSHRGLARELAALLKSSLHPKAAPETPVAQTASEEEVQLQSPTCPYYASLPIRGVQVAPSPEWLQNRLTAIGLRPVNNVVDITNFLLHDLGQPLHAFDAQKVTLPLVVRPAEEGESFTPLDGPERQLAPRDTLISDTAGQALALGGVMGGLESGVSAETTDLILEAAWFEPTAIRTTARHHQFHTDSSYRFERGVEPGGVLPALRLAARWITELAGGTIDGPIRLAGAPPTAPSPVELRPERLTDLLDGSLSTEGAEDILTRLGLEKIDGTHWRPPSWRSDLTRPADLWEEVARVHGLEAIPARHDGPAVPESAEDQRYDQTLQLKRHLAALGFSEVSSLKLISHKTFSQALPQAPLRPEELVTLSRPLSEDYGILRPSLSPGLLAAATRNLSHQRDTLRLFEIGRVFRHSPGGKARDLESEHLAVLLTGPRQEANWDTPSGSALDLFDLLGLLQTIFPGQRVRLQPDRDSQSLPDYILSGSCVVDGKKMGRYGQLSPRLQRQFKSEHPLILAEIPLNRILPPLGQSLQVAPLAQYPGSTRDAALEVPCELANAEIEKALSAHREPLLLDALCLDLFHDPSGEKLEATRKSLTYRFHYRSPERTLKQKEVDGAHQALLDHLAKALPVTFR